MSLVSFSVPPFTFLEPQLRLAAFEQVFVFYCCDCAGCAGKRREKISIKISSIHSLCNLIQKIEEERKRIQNQIYILYCDKIIITIALFSYFLYLNKSETIVSSQNFSK